LAPSGGLNAVIVGSGSEIGQNLAKRLQGDGWCIGTPWDLLILCRGTLEPIGKFFDCNEREWLEGVWGNMEPLSAMRNHWPQRKPGAQVVFLGGPNMAKPNETYSAYRCGKAVLEALAPTLNAEYREHRFHILHPGVVNTKIHQQTIAAGDRAANLERVKRIVNGEEKTVTHGEVYERLRALIG